MAESTINTKGIRMVDDIAVVSSYNDYHLQGSHANVVNVVSQQNEAFVFAIKNTMGNGKVYSGTSTGVSAVPSGTRISVYVFEYQS